MISALFIHDSKGDVLISKLYKEGVKKNISDVFRIQVITSNIKSNRSDVKDVRSPVLTLGSTSFIYIRSGLLWICAVTRSNQDCSVILEFLFHFESILKSLFIKGHDINNPLKKDLTEEIITNNFYVIYELLDEIIEFGYPTGFELNALKSNMTTVSSGENIFRSSVSIPTSMLKRNSTSKDAQTGIRKTSLTDISWREEGKKYRRNEAFLNVDEKINALFNADGEILRCDVKGSINMKTHLSGMPECRFGFANDNVLLTPQNKEYNASSLSANVKLEDCQFHQCVDLNVLDAERAIQFIPPDGDFQLMSYNCYQNINLPFEVRADVSEKGRDILMYNLRVSSLFPSKVMATNVIVRLPTPKGVIKSNTSTSTGKSKFHPEEDVIIWKINKVMGGSELQFSSEVQLSDNKAKKSNTNSPVLNWDRQPIKLDFELEMFSCSGLAVKYLKVFERTNYKTVKWVKYCSKSGYYDIRY